MAIGQTAKAQVEYTDLDPDVTVMTAVSGARDSVFLDINNDGTNEFLIIHGNGDWYGSFISIRMQNQNKGAFVKTALNYACSTWGGLYNFPAKFDQGSMIPDVDSLFTPLGSNASFSYSMQLGWASTGGTCVSGPWKGVTDKYIGVRFALDDSTSFHYGWIRLDVAADFGSAIIKDYAYEQTADTKISAGDGMPVSDRNGILDREDLQVFSSGSNVIIKASGDFRAEAEIINTLGQRVKVMQIREGRTEIPVNRSGIYFIRVSTEDAMITRKVFIQ